ncbi:DUF5304 family protein [Streptomyces mexicanus]|uniref:DUF5304 family protein n=1 Tax=Streptomyces mexicanus TaxID=178566 RepID=UPI0031E82A58
MSEERPPSDDAARDDTAQGRTADEAAPGAVDADAWATACADALAAEELRKFVDAVADKLSSLQAPLLGAVAGPAAQQVVRQVVQQAKAAVEPVIERNPDVFDHLAAAGSELLAAYRSAVTAQERRWTSGGEGLADDLKDLDDRPGRRDGGEGTGGGERIDLD